MLWRPDGLGGDNSALARISSYKPGVRTTTNDPNFPKGNLMIRTISTFSILLALLLLAAPGSAQTRIIPQVGLYVSVSDLGELDTADGIRNVGEHESSLAYGVTLDFASHNTLGFRITGLYGSKSEIPVDGVGCTGSECDLQTTLLGVSGSVVLRLLPPSSPFRPYVLGGGGMKRFDFEFSSDSQLEDAIGDESQGSLVLGAGLDWDLGFLSGNLELTDFISDSILDGGDRQHDFFLTVGLILG